MKTYASEDYTDDPSGWLVLKSDHEAAIAAIHERHPSEDGHWDIEHIRALLNIRDQLRKELKDYRYLVAALLKEAGGRVELSMPTVISIGPQHVITTWNDPILDKKIYVLTEASTSSDKT